MAIFKFRCAEHGDFSKFLKEGTESYPCAKCGASSERVVKAGGVIVTEKIDNGMMSRAVERPVNVEELNAERSAVHKAKQTGDKLV